MVAELALSAIEQSTYVIQVAFTDENGDDITPVTATWTLTDEAGAVINSRLNVAITPATVVDIVLSGDDLAVDAATGARRILTVAGTYDSTLGSGLPFRSHIAFSVEGLFT